MTTTSQWVQSGKLKLELSNLEKVLYTENNVIKAEVIAYYYELAKLHYCIFIDIKPAFLNNYFNLDLILAMTHQYGEAIMLLSTYRKQASGDEQKAAVELIDKLELLQKSGQ